LQKEKIQKKKRKCQQTLKSTSCTHDTIMQMNWRRENETCWVGKGEESGEHDEEHDAEHWAGAW